MKTITLHVSPEVERRLRMLVGLRIMANKAGSVDAFVSKLLAKLEAGDAEWTPEVRKASVTIGEPEAEA